jgi:hypothetical protein
MQIYSILPLVMVTSWRGRESFDDDVSLVALEAPGLKH